MNTLFFFVGFSGLYALVAQFASWSWGPQLLLKAFELLIYIPGEFIAELLIAILEGVFSSLD